MQGAAAAALGLVGGGAGFASEALPTSDAGKVRSAGPEAGQAGAGQEKWAGTQAGGRASRQAVWLAAKGSPWRGCAHFPVSNCTAVRSQFCCQAPSVITTAATPAGGGGSGQSGSVHPTNVAMEVGRAWRAGRGSRQAGTCPHPSGSGTVQGLLEQDWTLRGAAVESSHGQICMSSVSLSLSLH